MISNFAVRRQATGVGGNMHFTGDFRLRTSDFRLNLSFFRNPDKFFPVKNFDL